MRDTTSSLVRVTAAVLEQDGCILIARRSSAGHLAGKWELPGGKVKEGETPEQCLARELREELNLSVSVGEFLGTSNYRYDHMRIELLLYRVTLMSGEPMALVHDAFRWVTPGEMAQYDFSPADLPFVRKLESGEIDL